jgi:hypothetical protein
MVWELTIHMRLFFYVAGMLHYWAQLAKKANLMKTRSS